MQQLPLPVRLRTSSVFASFFAGSNADLVQCFQQQQFGVSPVAFLYGAHGTGKTHLLQAICVHASQRRQLARYISSADLLSYGAELLSGSAQLSLLCIDDADVLFTDATWNRVLFNIYREFDDSHAKLILSAEQPPAFYPWPLADLASRMLASSVFRLQPLNEDEQLQALRLHAMQRGLDLPDETAQYLLRRLPRDMTTLCSFLDELDVASLAAQRRLTVPFVKQVLDEKHS